MQWAKQLWRKVPAPSLALGVLGWAMAAVFFMFWLFDVGGGPFSPDRFGTAGEWASGLATAGTLALAVYVLLRDRHLQAMERLSEARRAELRELVGSFADEAALADEAKRFIPIRGWWRRLDRAGTADTDEPNADGDYVVGFELYNGLDRPLASLGGRLSLTGDWTMKDYETQPIPPSVRLCEELIVPPGKFFRYEMEEGSYFRLPMERVNSGSYMTAEWKIGDHQYHWSHYGRTGATYLNVTAPERVKKREAAARAMRRGEAPPAAGPATQDGTPTG